MLFFLPIYPAWLHGQRTRFDLNCCRGPCPKRSTNCPTSRVVAEAFKSPEAEDGAKVALYQDDGSRVIPVPLFVAATREQIIAGVYAVLDEDRELVYVGTSRDIASSLVHHIENHTDDVFYVKMMTFREPSVQEMKRVAELWILDNEITPKGNLEEWYEVDEELARQLNQIPADIRPPQEPRISPFADDPYAPSGPQQIMNLTAANVDLVLDEVRPYLIADGGNVSVEHVNCDTGRVELLLEGACHSCSSAATTMQLGIEKALREKFGDNLGEVAAVNTTNVENESSLEVCERALDTIRNTLRGLGGEVAVVEVDEDEVILSFSGPEGLKHGIEKTLIQRVPEIKIVTFE